jgi:hypothetical protein
MDESSILKCADRLRSRNIDPIPNYLLLRDVLARPSDDAVLIEAAERYLSSKWMEQLAATQWADGSWGRLHSMDTSTRPPIPTTEAGVERALALGLDSRHPILVKASRYLGSVLTGQIDIRDRAESNERWLLGVELFAASTLARILPRSPLLVATWNKWCRIAERAVASGQYESEAELEAHRQLHGVDARGSYLRLSSRYALALLSSRADAIPPAVEAALFQWIWHRESGIGYYGPQAAEPPQFGAPREFELWMRTQELLAVFPSWRASAGPIIGWLWAQQNPNAQWDFGSRWPPGFVFPYSESWRRRGARQNDWTTRVLLLSAKAVTHD